MELKELSESEKEQYNNFVAAFGGSFLQSWEWGGWQQSLGREVRRYMLTDGAAIKMTVQLARMSLWGRMYYWYAAYGPVGAGSCDSGLVATLDGMLRQKEPDAVFLRLEPQKKIPGLPLVAKKTINIQPGITMVVDLNETEDNILAAMHPKTRYNIKLASRHGVVVESELVVTPGHGLYVQQAVDLILQTQIRQKYKGHSSDYYHRLINFFALRSDHSDVTVRIYKALYNRQLLAAGIMVDFANTRMYLYGGSADDYKNIMAPYALHWQAMRDAKQAGFTQYDLGGSEVSGGGQRGFTRFKQGFGGRIVEYSGAYDFVQKPLWYTVYRLARTVNRFLLRMH